MQGVVLCALSVMVSGVVVRLARYPHASSLPSFLTSALLSLSTVLCLGSYARRVSHDGYISSKRESFVGEFEGC